MLANTFLLLAMTLLISGIALDGILSIIVLTAAVILFIVTIVLQIKDGNKKR